MGSWNRATVVASAIAATVSAALIGGVFVAVADEDRQGAPAISAPETIAVADDDDDEPAAVDLRDTEVVDPDDRPMTNAEVERVSNAALEFAGDGTISDVDRSDDLGEAYEVEVVTDAGELDIALDEELNRVRNLRFDD